MLGKEDMGFEDPNAYSLGLLASVGFNTPVLKREWFIDIDVTSVDAIYSIGIRVFGFWVALGFVLGEETV